MRYVLDSSALLAVAYNEVGADQVSSLLDEAVLSSVNLAECMTSSILKEFDGEQSRALFLGMVPDIIPFDQNLAFIAASLIPLTKPYGLSLGDRACLATAAQLGLEAVTADKVWSKIKNGPRIIVIR